MFKVLIIIIYCLVIIEEAAEVLEPHIIASMSEFCKHLILIGKAILLIVLITYIFTDFKMWLFLYFMM